MKKTVRALWILMGVGVAGLALTIGIAMGTGTIGSKEDAKTYEINESIQAVELNTRMAQVSWMETAGSSTVNAFAKAWMEDDLIIDELVDVEVVDGVLQITEHPFADHFLGIFPQPYELNIILSVPKEVIDGVGGSI